MKQALRAIGPGLIMAGAAIGVSHLVQSTRAGADFGFSLWWVIALACATKYPFLQYGPRYAAATGESLVDGYRRLGRWALILFAVLTIGTMFTTLAGVTVVTAGIAGRLVGVAPDARLWSAAILSLCVLVLIAGRYPALDLLMKVMMVLLSLSTVAAVVLAFAQSEATSTASAAASLSSTSLPFIVALMGWMPIPIDVAVWHSLWTLERRRQTDHAPSVREAVRDFNLGYALAFAMALAFLSLGALLMFGTGERFATGAVPFAEQLVGLYTRTLGDFSAPLITLAVLTTMFSTTLAVTDAYPRVVERFFSRKGEQRSGRRIYLTSMLAISFGALLILFVFAGQMTLLIDVATSLAFLSAPVLGWMNLRLVTSDHMPEHAQPPSWLVTFSWFGLIALALFCVSFVWTIIA